MREQFLQAGDVPIGRRRGSGKPHAEGSALLPARLQPCVLSVLRRPGWNAPVRGWAMLRGPGRRRAVRGLDACPDVSVEAASTPLSPGLGFLLFRPF